MKKLGVLSVFLLCMLMLTSCTSFRGGFRMPSFKSDYSEKDADEAMHLTVERAIDSTNTRFFQKLSTNNYVPDYYIALIEKQNEIPGMKKLIELWNNEVNTVLTQEKEEISSQILTFAQSVEFENPKALVEESDTSGSNQLIQKYSNEFKDLLSSVLEKLDGSKLETIVKHYNAWVISQNYINKTYIPQLNVIDYKSSIVEKAYTYYTETLMMFEELYRTTPDPFTEEVCQKVFGIQ